MSVKKAVTFLTPGWTLWQLQGAQAVGACE